MNEIAITEYVSLFINFIIPTKQAGIFIQVISMEPDLSKKRQHDRCFLVTRAHPEGVETSLFT